MTISDLAFAEGPSPPRAHRSDPPWVRATPRTLLGEVPGRALRAVRGVRQRGATRRALLARALHRRTDQRAVPREGDSLSGVVKDWKEFTACTMLTSGA